MPLLVASLTPPPQEPPPDTAPHAITVTWTMPGGQVLDLTRPGRPGISVLAGVDGFGAAPRAVTRRARSTGGSLPRWSYAAERLLTLPLKIHGTGPASFLALRRQVTLAFTATTPAAAPPRPGLLKVTRADGSWRHIGAIYLDGLGWSEDASHGASLDLPVLSLLAPDPWWYSAAQVAAEFATAEPRDYLDPYQTVSPDASLGQVEITVAGDASASPSWSVTGPASRVDVGLSDGTAGWSLGAIGAGETITLDTDACTVTDHSGANRIGLLRWPTSTLFQLQPGPNTLDLKISGGVAGQSAIRLTYRPRWETA